MNGRTPFTRVELKMAFSDPLDGQMVEPRNNQLQDIFFANRSNNHGFVLSLQEIVLSPSGVDRVNWSDIILVASLAI